MFKDFFYKLFYLIPVKNDNWQVISSIFVRFNDRDNNIS